MIDYFVPVCVYDIVIMHDFSAPTGPPLNPNGVTLSITLLTLSWSPPEPIHINGIIDHYVVNVLEVYSNQVFVLITKDTSIQVGPLHPFYLYECTVAAYTVGLGPFSSPVSVQAGETRKTSITQHDLNFFVNYIQSQLQHLKT